MDHADAVSKNLIEQYLLHEMSPQLRDEFEEHFFDCQMCAADLRATSAFLDATRTELKRAESRPAAVIPIADKRPRQFIWKPALALYALAASLLVVVYQNAFVYPRLKSEVAELRTPEVLPSISLVGDNSRGGNTPSAPVGDAQAFLLLVDLPTQDRFSTYTCLLYAPSGELIWSLGVSAQQARDTVSIRIPPGKRSAGRYSLLVKGNQSELAKDSSTAGDATQYKDQAAAATGIDLARYNFVLDAVSTNSGH